MEHLTTHVQHYDWGDPEFIARLQGRTPSGRPEAELWVGTHPGAPSSVTSSGQLLTDLIAADTGAAFGDDARPRSPRLPFLTKILAAARPLSIQAHPTVPQAQAGHAREDSAGVAVDAPERIYRDRNHKPELLCALSRFEARCGFRELDDSRALFAAIGTEALAPLREILSGPGPATEVLRKALRWLLGRTDIAAEVTDAAISGAGRVPKGGPWHVDLVWLHRIAAVHPHDPGAVAALLLNHVVLEPGQGIFLGAGNLHSYLRGAGVEVMAASDNVVRGGLTNKHVDVDELLAIVDPTPQPVFVQVPQGRAHTFDAPVPDFALTRVLVDGEVRLDVDGPETVLVTDGRLVLEPRGGERLTVGPGESVWVPAADERYTARGRGVLYRTTQRRPASE